MLIKIETIKINERMREVSEDKVTEIASSIKEIGLLNPITISENNVLIAGLHRLNAFKMLGYKEIEANVVPLSGLKQELAEIDENLIRADLHFIDRGDHLKRRKEIYELLHPETKAGGDRKSEEVISKGNNYPLIPTFIKDTASKIGQSESTIKQEIQISNNLSSEMKQQVKKADLSKTEALKLARLEPEKQKEIMKNITTTKQAMNATVYSHNSLEYYTPQEYIEVAREVMGSIDTDPATCEAPQKWIKAKTFYTEIDDGLSKNWYGNVWLNPPYSKTNGQSNQEIWALKLLDEYKKGNVISGVLLVKAALGYNWFEKLWDILPVCFARERLSFVLSNGSNEGQSKQATAFFYIGKNIDGFKNQFSKFGRVILP